MGGRLREHWYLLYDYAEEKAIGNLSRSELEKCWEQGRGRKDRSQKTLEKEFCYKNNRGLGWLLKEFTEFKGGSSFFMVLGLTLCLLDKRYPTELHPCPAQMTLFTLGF